MRATIDIDDKLLTKAQEYTGIKDISVLLHEALMCLVAREAARRLVTKGGSDPTALVGLPRKPELQ